MPVSSANSKRDLPAWAQAYAPLFSGGDAQTICARYWQGSIDEWRWPTESRLFDTVDGVKVLAKINRGGGRGVVVIVHGLTACSEARYMLTLANSALNFGFDTIRLNVRTCGGTEHLSPTLYHSGLTDDIRSVVDQLAPKPVFLAGFSMGGNMALKLAGEWGDAAPAHVKGVGAISAPIRLDECSRRIGERRNRIYEYRFLRQLRAAVRKKQSLDPSFWPDIRLAGIDSVYAFDEAVTAKTFGFDSAAHYYEQSSAAKYLEEIRVPTVLLQSEDDPFIPFHTYELSTFHDNSAVQLITARTGGHVAFLSRNPQRFWAESQLVRFFDSLVGDAA